MIGISTCIDPYTPMVYLQFIMMGVSRCVDPHTHMLEGLLRDSRRTLRVCVRGAEVCEVQKYPRRGAEVFEERCRSMCVCEKRGSTTMHHAC